MQDDIDIRKYTDFFHDGNLFNILRKNDNIELWMSSAEVNPMEVENRLILSQDHRIRGILHLCNLRNVHLTGEYKLDSLFHIFNLGTILDFDILQKTVELGVLWENFLPKIHTNEFTTIVIQAERIWWENIPGLRAPSLRTY